ncbi:MAG: hypothetical protein B7X53_03785 [Hyphomonas sp. 34-62-18]|nr:MAG: hypothetical protein B7X53_03785 [Hyphomonas sp. 34-62-18]
MYSTRATFCKAGRRRRAHVVIFRWIGFDLQSVAGSFDRFLNGVFPAAFQSTDAAMLAWGWPSQCGHSRAGFGTSNSRAQKPRHFGSLHSETAVP